MQIHSIPRLLMLKELRFVFLKWTAVELDRPLCVLVRRIFALFVLPARRMHRARIERGMHRPYRPIRCVSRIRVVLTVLDRCTRSHVHACHDSVCSHEWSSITSSTRLRCGRHQCVFGTRTTIRIENGYSRSFIATDCNNDDRTYRADNKSRTNRSSSSTIHPNRCCDRRYCPCVRCTCSVSVQSTCTVHASRR